MNVLPGGKQNPPSPPLQRGDQKEQWQRRGLLAKVHIAKKEMGLNSGEYEAILKGFKVESAKDLSIPQLERMVKYLKYLGWKPRPGVRGQGAGGKNESFKLDALRKRVIEEAKDLENWETRLPGLVKSICGVMALNWVHSAAKLERLLVVLSSIKKADRMKVSARRVK